MEAPQKLPRPWDVSAEPAFSSERPTHEKKRAAREKKRPAFSAKQLVFPTHHPSPITSVRCRECSVYVIARAFSRVRVRMRAKAYLQDDYPHLSASDAFSVIYGRLRIIILQAKAVMGLCCDGIVSVSGVDDGTNIAVYGVDGQLAGTAKASSNQAMLATSLRKGDMLVVKIGDKSLKVMMQ